MNSQRVFAAIFLFIVLFNLSFAQDCSTAGECDDNNICTDDFCVSGSCVHINVCVDPVPSPDISISAIASFSRTSASSIPSGPVIISSSPDPSLVVLSATRSAIPPSSPSVSPVIPISGSRTAQVPPSGFPVQSESPTFIPCPTLTPSTSFTPTVSGTPEPSRTPDTQRSSYPSQTNPPETASITPSSSAIPASPLPFRVGQPTMVLIQLECSVSCCDNFTASWSDLVEINDETLVDILTCVAISNNLVAITINQFGSNFYYANQIISQYWLKAGCASENPWTDGPCYPTEGYLSAELSDVVELDVLSGKYVSTLDTTQHTSQYNTLDTIPYSYSSAEVLTPLFLTFVFAFLIIFVMW